MDEAAQAHGFQVADGGLLRLGLGDMPDGHGGQGAVIQHVFVVEEVEALKDHADLLTQGVEIGVQDGQVLTVEPDVAAVRLFEKVQTAQQGGLAGAGGTDDADHLAFVYVQVDAFEDFQ